MAFSCARQPLSPSLAENRNPFSWDFFTTLDFEWDYITGRRKFRWTLLLYSLSRLGALGTTICNLVGYNVTHQINCQVRCVSERCPPSLLI
ncbi:hypothetical protein EDB85DRAFT_1300571 [Lactarius pseudohatsudake]|nr:hypothetical protein EDB85DRAFT_1300571 [Lactarius pseudohatsudake]